MEAMIEKELKPIYQALDRNQFSKALKLTQEKPQSSWPITVSLRVHCLHRCGKSLEACTEIRGLLGVLGGDWKELDDRIWLLGLGSEDNSEYSLNAKVSSGPTTGTGNKSKKGSSPLVELSSVEDKANEPLDFSHVLDLTLKERRDMATSKVRPFLSMDAADILDEVRTLQFSNDD